VTGSSEFGFQIPEREKDFFPALVMFWLAKVEQFGVEAEPMEKHG
jgi:hypothetical protein